MQQTRIPFGDLRPHAHTRGSRPEDARVPDQWGKRLITVLLCTHNLLIRKGLRKILEEDAHIQVVAETGHADEAVRLAREHLPDVLFIELDVPFGEGLRLSRMVTGTAGDRTACVVFLAQSLDSATALRGLLAGARAFLAKSDPPRQMVAAVHAVAAGYAVLPPGMIAALEPWANLSAVTMPASADVFSVLTARELEVLRLMATGMSNGEIADFLSLGEATVKSHVSRLLSKLGLRNRSQAVARAYGTGLIRVPTPCGQ